MELSKINSFTTATANQAVADIAAKVEGGTMYAGEAFALAKLLETIAEGIRKAVPLHEDWQGRGASVKLGSTTSYDYTNTPEWVAIENAVKGAKEAQKQIEAEAQRLAKAGTGHGAIVRVGDGEIIEVAPAIATYSGRITVTLDKA
jgi:hypothetical protein